MISGRLLMCDYCGTPATFCPSSAHVYNGRNRGPIWHCVNCDAWVGCHKGEGGTWPLGSLAKAEIRSARQAAHAAFDPVWQAMMSTFSMPRNKARTKAYAWLATALGIDVADCHIAMFDEATCTCVIEVCTNPPAETPSLPARHKRSPQVFKRLHSNKVPHVAAPATEDLDGD